MKCRPGDLAIIVGVHSKDLGKAVTCRRLVGSNHSVNIPSDVGAVWEVDREVHWYEKRGKQYKEALYKMAADEALMPIRPDEIDETRNHEATV